MQERNAWSLYSARPPSTDLLCRSFPRCGCTRPTRKCRTRKQPHTNVGVMLKGKSWVKMKTMALEKLRVACAPLPLTSAGSRSTCAQGAPHRWGGTCCWSPRWESAWSILRNNCSCSSAQFNPFNPFLSCLMEPQRTKHLLFLLGADEEWCLNYKHLPHRETDYLFSPTLAWKH